MFSYAALNFLFSSWAEFQFYLKAIQKMFNVRTRTPEIFRQSNSKKYEKKWDKLGISLDGREQHVHLGKLGFCTQIWLYIQYCLGCIGEDATQVSDKAKRWFIIGRQR